MAAIWFFMMISSILISIFTGKANLINNSVLTSPAQAITFCLGLMGNMCLWLGIMRIAEKSGVVEKVSELIKPVIKLVFKDIPEKHKAFKCVTMSLVANMMGIGNAATAFGLKAMQELQRLNKFKDTASDSMCMFIVVNSFMIQLIHTNTIYIRSLVGAKEPTGIMPVVTIATFVTLICGIVITKLYQYLFKKYKVGEVG